TPETAVTRMTTCKCARPPPPDEAGGTVPELRCRLLTHRRLIIGVTAPANATEQDLLSLNLDGSTSIADLKNPSGAN
ncbi:MAG: hypothetical protein M1826_004776, partial [Phylliscum demangeonii]